MNYYLDRTEFQIYERDFYIFPTIRLIINNLVYVKKNIAVEFHWLVFHGRLLFFSNRW
jgi:hypothetical protein